MLFPAFAGYLPYINIVFLSLLMNFFDYELLKKGDVLSHPK